jgi:hypothetical protein
MDFLFLSLLKMKKLDKTTEIMDIYIQKFIPFTCEMILLKIEEWPIYFIFWTEQSELDLIVNTMKSKAFQFLSYIIQSENVTTVKNSILIDNINKIVNVIIDNLNFVIDQKMYYLAEMNKNSDKFKDNGYESLLFQIILFLSRILTREPFISTFSKFIEK